MVLGILGALGVRGFGRVPHHNHTSEMDALRVNFLVSDHRL